MRAVRSGVRRCWMIDWAFAGSGGRLVESSNSNEAGRSRMIERVPSAVPTGLTPSVIITTELANAEWLINNEAFNASIRRAKMQ